jgi:hypothetical protein
MRVLANEERAGDALLLTVLTDRLRNGEDMGFVEAAFEGRTAVARGAKRHALRRHGGIGRFGKVSGDELGNVDQLADVREFARVRMCLHV